MSNELSSWAGAEGPGHGRHIGKLPDVQLSEMQCGLAHCGWSHPSEFKAYQLILVRCGGFLHRHAGVSSFINATTALYGRLGDEVQVAHPLDYPDRFLAIQFVEPPDVGLPAGPITVPDNVDLLHRIVAAACSTDTDGFELAANVTSIVGMLSGRPVQDGRLKRPATAVGHRRMVEAAIEALLNGGFRLGLAELATLVGASPSHLSRVFHRITGTPLRVYRNQLRVRSVLAKLQDGASSLTDLAMEHGFADHSHLDRVVRRHLGRQPSSLRALLAPNAET
jgi:AraC-like DNA-binding protein